MPRSAISRAARPHRQRSSWQHSSAPAWRKRRLHATGTASPASRHWMPHAPFSWKSSARPCASRDGSAINCAPSSPFNPPCTECHHDVPLPLSAGLNFRDALAYLRLTAETRRENRAALEWWDAFLLKTPSYSVFRTSNQ